MSDAEKVKVLSELLKEALSEMKAHQDEHETYVFDLGWCPRCEHGVPMRCNLECRIHQALSGTQPKAPTAPPPRPVSEDDQCMRHDYDKHGICLACDFNRYADGDIDVPENDFPRPQVSFPNGRGS